MVVVLIAGFALLVGTRGSVTADDEAEWWLYDAGLQFSAAEYDEGAPFALAIDYFTSGSPPVRWSDSSMPIEICTHQANRPDWVSAETFRDAVREGAAMWNRAGAAAGYRYVGDCSSGSAWQDGNEVNEIAFDDARNFVSFPSAALTRGSWVVSSGSRTFTEVNVIIHRELEVPEVCFRSVIAHELGHGLGFGHSDNMDDLMYPSFNAHDPLSCPLEATARERAWLVELYGSNTPPQIDQPSTETVQPGQAVTLSVGASSGAGASSLSYFWEQVSGPPVDFSIDGSIITFVTPNSPGSEIQFAVDVYDRYYAHAGVALTARIGQPAPVGTFEGSLPSAGGVALIVWGGGSVDSLAATVNQGGCDLTSTWTSSAGRFIGFVIGAPSFVNEDWVAVYPGEIPDGRPLITVCRA